MNTVPRRNVLPSPELSNPLVVKKVGDAIRTLLVARGMKETAAAPDIVVHYNITSEDFSEQRGGPAAFSQATLVIDLVRRDSNALVWRSVYRDDEKNNAKLSQRLPEVRKSMAGYPPRQKRTSEPAPAAAQFSALQRALSPTAAAYNVLEIINSTRQDKAYVGGAAHPGLEANLNALERAARAVIGDGSRGQTAARANALAKAIRDTSAFATSITGRRGETPADRAESRELAGKLLSLLVGWTPPEPTR